jgi:hypothetical protein
MKETRNRYGMEVNLKLIIITVLPLHIFVIFCVANRWMDDC